MEDRIYDLLVKKNEVTWQTIIYELVKSGEMDPWNVDLSKLSGRYISAIKNLKEHNFFISGKMVLASALLLRMKSDRLLNEHIAEFDSVLYPADDDLLLEDENDYKYAIDGKDIPKLMVKSPQSRKRQVSLNELMSALEKALEVDERRRIRRIYEEPVIQEAVLPKNVYNISDLIKSVYEKIIYMFKKKEILNFSELLETDSKEDKVTTFIPLLHLCNQHKIELDQEKAFGDIKITLMD
ncbi:segregation/condensation protein A [Candidatus Woesearchaeota archaeon]|jgi:segregation and condensation protein A|nr:segregation/condensation protein A [Candidatus Woesearchaeota archaeon]MBT6045097.1 segregation/condensation protein A [Candidatus Woesearchaeota archaeon]